ncbi:cysteine synthase family protein [Sulfodiicoccus acidiphilus]|nr:cysteine synthase family protein [Sulfodiicoccus acidiphilus]
MWPTPLLRLPFDGDVWAKLEFYNPFSKSVKDRTAWFLFKEALKKDSKWIMEATSGNTGLALAALSAYFKVKFTCFLPTTSPNSFKVMLKMLGADVQEMGSRTSEIVPLVKQLAQASGAINLDQFNSELNVEAHYRTTGIELERQLRAVGKVPKNLVATLGTAGHIIGVARYLREVYGDLVRIVGVQPAIGSGIPGIKRLESDNRFIKTTKIDEVVDVTAEEAAEGALRVARAVGLLVGPSAGATVAATMKLSLQGTTVLIFPDDASKYLDFYKRYLGL